MTALTQDDGMDQGCPWLLVTGRATPWMLLEVVGSPPNTLEQS